MNSRQLSPQQIATLMRKARKTAAYLRALSGRIHQKQFPHDDPLRRAADDALAAVESYHDRVWEIGKGMGVSDPCQPARPLGCKPGDPLK